MDECVEGAATGTDGELPNHLVAALLCMRAKRLCDKGHLDLAIEAQASVTRRHKQRLLANAFTIAAVMAASSPRITRERWAFERNERWFEDTLPNLGEFHFKQALRVSPTTFRYLVDSCRCVLERETTNMRESISVEKRMAVGLYRLCSSAEDRTIAHLFGIGRSTVNVIYREVCSAVIAKLEGKWIRMVPQNEMTDHIREFYSVSGFPQAVGALDGCHFPVSPPKDSATDYHNYKGW